MMAFLIGMRESSRDMRVPVTRSDRGMKLMLRRLESDSFLQFVVSVFIST